MVGKNCRLHQCSTTLQMKPIRISRKETPTVEGKIRPGLGFEPGSNAFSGRRVYFVASCYIRVDDSFSSRGPSTLRGSADLICLIQCPCASSCR